MEIEKNTVKEAHAPPRYKYLKFLKDVQPPYKNTVSKILLKNSIKYQNIRVPRTSISVINARYKIAICGHSYCTGQCSSNT